MTDVDTVINTGEEQILFIQQFQILKTVHIMQYNCLNVAPS